jgi:predicted ATPase
MTQMRRGLEALQATGGAVRLPYYWALLAEAAGRAGQGAEGLTFVSKALAQIASTGESWYEAALHRLKGELLARAQDQRAAALGCFQDALAVARRQDAKALELRAAMSLSRFWQQQGKHAAAYELLAPIYGWFTEGFDTADLQEAKALLDELGA